MVQYALTYKGPLQKYSSQEMFEMTPSVITPVRCLFFQNKNISPVESMSSLFYCDLISSLTFPPELKKRADRREAGKERGCGRLYYWSEIFTYSCLSLLKGWNIFSYPLNFGFVDVTCFGQQNAVKVTACLV